MIWSFISVLHLLLTKMQFLWKKVRMLERYIKFIPLHVIVKHILATLSKSVWNVLCFDQGNGYKGKWIFVYLLDQKLSHVVRDGWKSRSFDYQEGTFHNCTFVFMWFQFIDFQRMDCNKRKTMTYGADVGHGGWCNFHVIMMADFSLRFASFK